MKFNTKLLSFLSLGLLLVSCSNDTNNKIYFGIDSNKFDALIGVKDKEVSSNNDKGTSYKITYGINHTYGYFNSYLYNNVTVYDVTYNSNDEFPRPSYEDYEVVSFFDDEISFITSANVNPLPKVNADGLIIGAPIYMMQPNGYFRCFSERFCYPYSRYGTKETYYPNKKQKGALVFSMGAPKEMYPQFKAALDVWKEAYKRAIPDIRYLDVFRTWHVHDFPKYDLDCLNEPERKAYNDATWETSLNEAYKIGQELAATE